ncbi:hypothetical protein ACERII_19435 [Evansella sp. AB-rgal1]|uniref:hypothetical protein n=1 Tax=Evansella sp. AB-rgal1 TaxID=3242696 RepID=UPI00359E33F0
MKETLLFWVFFLLILYVSHHFYFYFIDPLLILFYLDVMYLVIFPVIFIPLSAVLAKITKNYFLSNN